MKCDNYARRQQILHKDLKQQHQKLMHTIGIFEPRGETHNVKTHKTQ
jgi:hypothetical protein